MALLSNLLNKAKSAVQSIVSPVKKPTQPAVPAPVAKKAVAPAKPAPVTKSTKTAATQKSVQPTKVTTPPAKTTAGAMAPTPVKTPTTTKTTPIKDPHQAAIDWVKKYGTSAQKSQTEAMVKKEQAQSAGTPPTTTPPSQPTTTPQTQGDEVKTYVSASTTGQAKQNDFVFGTTAKQQEQQQPGYLGQRNTELSGQIMSDPRLTSSNVDQMVDEKLKEMGIDKFQTSPEDVANTKKTIADMIRAKQGQDQTVTDLSSRSGSELAVVATPDELELLKAANPEKYQEVLKAKQAQSDADAANEAVSGESPQREAPKPPDYAAMMKEAGLDQSDTNLQTEYNRIFNNPILTQTQTALADLDTTLQTLQDKKANLKEDLKTRFKGMGVLEGDIDALYYEEVQGIDREINTTSIQRNNLQAKYDTAMAAAQNEYKAVQEQAQADEERKRKVFEARYGMAKDQYEKERDQYEKEIETQQKEKETASQREREAQKMMYQDKQKEEAYDTKREDQVEDRDLKRGYQVEDRNMKYDVQREMKQLDYQTRLNILERTGQQRIDVMNATFEARAKYGGSVTTTNVGDKTLIRDKKNPGEILSYVDSDGMHVMADMHSTDYQKSVDAQLETAKSYLGTKYVRGGNDKKGIDCSGFVGSVLVKNGVLPEGTRTTAQGLYNMFKGTEIPTNNLKKGDLLFFENTKDEPGYKKGQISHTAYYMGQGANGKIQVMDASPGAGTSIREIPVTGNKAFNSYILHGTPNPGVPGTKVAPQTPAKTATSGGLVNSTLTQSFGGKSATGGAGNVEGAASYIADGMKDGKKVSFTNLQKKFPGLMKTAEGQKQISESYIQKHVSGTSSVGDVAKAYSRLAANLSPTKDLMPPPNSNSIGLYDYLPQMAKVVGSDKAAAAAISLKIAHLGTMKGLSEETQNDYLAQYITDLSKLGVKFDARKAIVMANNSYDENRKFGLGGDRAGDILSLMKQ